MIGFSLKVKAIFIAFMLVAGSVSSQEERGGEEYNSKDHYDKVEYMIPMRDGAQLFTAVYTPKDRSRDYPILLHRTSYSIRYYGESYVPAETMGPSKEFAKEGYIFVYQDIRGTFKSEGDFEPVRAIRSNKSDPKATDDSSDNYDTIEWLTNNIKGHNERVGQWGISYEGWTTVMGMVDAHPALKASSPQASPSDMFIGDDWHHNGVFRLMYSFQWMSRRGLKRDVLTEKQPEPFNYEGTPWGYKFFLNAGPTSELNDKYFNGRVPAWNDFIEHPNYDDFWEKQAVLPHLKDIKHPILNVAGWFDAEDFYGPVSIYHEIEKNNPDNQSTFVAGPWHHTGWQFGKGRSLGNIDFGSDTSDWYKDNVVFPFFQYHLKDKGNWGSAEAVVFETGGNRWHQFDSWPPEKTEIKNLYFHENGKLSFEKPTTADAAAADSYVDDPEKPVPYSTDIRTHPGHIWMVEDQRQVSTRPDVLVYQTEVLKEDVTLAGPTSVNLFASTSGTDSDFFVKLIDVYPGDAADPEPNPKGTEMGDFQMLVGVEVMRAKYRDSFSDPKPMKPNKATPVNFTIWDKFHTFKKGHRIMVQVHSSWFPAYDRNPHKFMDIYQAKQEDYQKATQKIYRSSKTASHLKLPIITLPK